MPKSIEPRNVIQAVVFDMDGLIVDSEPYWKQAEKRVFSSLGCNVTMEDQLQTANLTTEAVTDYWYRKSPWRQMSKHQAEAAVIEEVDALLSAQCVSKPGFFEAMAVCREAGIKIGLASNAPLCLCRTVIRALNCQDAFDCVLSSQMVAAGKPRPDIYLHALASLKVDAVRALALEDSPTGARAAKSAGMKVVGVPSEAHYFEPMLALADVVLESLAEFDARLLQKR
ncbi:hexitol phosphatase HxpB [Thiomicrorhabdus sp.]|uniref:hexitol phosphatase HxpB n=1 Tax=Thiomicrorhabdus sp. TaxID=2039724 RepID=UPI0029C63C38|nr:hexitol phosphatase HxpB [Thiomicrorhabdus sp.]